MKKAAFLISFALLFCITAQAQVLVGAYGGINKSNLKGDAPADGQYSSITGITAGAIFDLRLNDNLTISFQPGIDQCGTKVMYDVDGLTEPLDSIDLTINRIVLPLYLKASANGSNFYAVGGLETSKTSSTTIKSHDKELDHKLDVAEWDVAMIFGFGYRIPIGLPELFIEARYGQGLVNLTDNVNAKDYIPRVKNSGFKILAGIEIPIWNKKKSNN